MLQRQACLYVPPADLFGTERLSPCGRVDTALLVTSHEPGTTVSWPAETGEIAARMRACLVSERGSFLDHYQQFCFAFPGARSRLVDQAAETERRLLVDRLDHLPAARISHGYPVDIAALGRVVDGVARNAAAGSAAIPDADR